VVSWALSITVEVDFCVEALRRCLAMGKPEIFNTDQGSQFTSGSFTGVLEAAGFTISMDGRGRVYDNIFVERLWRSLKYEKVFLKEYATVWEARSRIEAYFRFSNGSPPGHALGYKPPYQVYVGTLPPSAGRDPILPKPRCTLKSSERQFFVLTKGVQLRNKIRLHNGLDSSHVSRDSVEKSVSRKRRRPFIGKHELEAAYLKTVPKRKICAMRRNAWTQENRSMFKAS
jgi:transposase InsO family protein